MKKVSIIGASGYTGVELIRLITSHPELEIFNLSGKIEKPEKISSIFKNLKKINELVCEEPDIDLIKKNSDAVFLAVPHKVAMSFVAELMDSRLKIVDLSADFRIEDAEIYEKWYTEHKHKELIEKAVYGLPEIHRDKIINSNLTANPGCYPTSIILGLAPLLANNIISTDYIIADSKTGVSGAGRELSLKTHYPECNENFLAYNVGKHRHTPEIIQELNKLSSDNKVNLQFTPHLAPMNRGILSTIYVKPVRKTSESELIDLYNDYYSNEFFIRILDIGELPETKNVIYSNFCDIGLVYDTNTGFIIVISAIDNLMKGASGQAIQNLNLMLGFNETTGLTSPGIYP